MDSENCPACANTGSVPVTFGYQRHFMPCPACQSVRDNVVLFPKAKAASVPVVEVGGGDG